MLELCKKRFKSLFIQGIIISLFLFLNILNVAASDFGYDNPTIPTLQPEEETGVTLDIGANYSINVNRSDYWDELDTPADIDWITYLGTYLVSFFDQWLNTTSDVTFNNVNVTEDVCIDGGNCITDLAKVGDCPAGYVVMNTTTNGVECVALETIFYNATSAFAETGTVSGFISYTQHPDGLYDDITLNLTEQASAPALLVYVNFTDVESFNQGILRYYTSNIQGNSPVIQLWDYIDGDWEDYPPITETLTYSVIEQPVFDGASHLQDGIVQMRINKSGTGNINNKYYIDWIAISKGLGTPSGMEVDPYSIHKDAINTTQMYYESILNINTTWVNSITSSSVNGTDINVTKIDLGSETGLFVNDTCMFFGNLSLRDLCCSGDC